MVDCLRNFLVEIVFLLFIRSHVTRDSLISSFSICNPLISISCLIAAVSVSSTMLKISRDSGQPHLIPNSSTISSKFYITKMMLAVDFSYKLSMLRNAHCSRVLSSNCESRQSLPSLGCLLPRYSIITED